MRLQAKQVLRLWLVSLCGTTICCAYRTAAPPRPVLAGLPVGATYLNDMSLNLGAFEIMGLGSQASRGDVEHLQDVMLDYLETKSIFKAVTYNLAGIKAVSPSELSLSVHLTIDQSSQRTYILDLLSLAFYGGWPFVPSWGDVTIDLDATLSRADTTIVADYHHAVQAPFDALFYSWFRTDYVERAYRRAYQDLFIRLATDIAGDAKKLRAAVFEPQPHPGPSEVAKATVQSMVEGHLPESSDQDLTDLPQRALPDPFDRDFAAAPPDAGAATVAAADSEVEASDLQEGLVVLPPEGFHVIRDVEESAFEPTLYGYLKLLGGIEFSSSKGLAHVSSMALDGGAFPMEVASGDATQSGYRVALYSAPKSTGFFWYPTLGYLSQRIANVDIDSYLGWLNRSVATDGDIPAVLSDPNTGSVESLGANIYHLEMKSGFAGLRGGLDLVSGNEDVTFFSSATVGVNLLEYRNIQTVLDSCGSERPEIACVARRRGLDGMKSWAAGGTFGVGFPKLHVGLRAIFDFEYYRKFRYERGLEVRGPATYNADKGLFEHPRLHMGAASLYTFTAELAAAVLF